MHHTVTKKTRFLHLNPPNLYYLTRLTSNKSADHLQQVGSMNITFSPIYEEEKADVERGVYETNNQPKRETFNYEKEGLFCLGVAKIESK